MFTTNTDYRFDRSKFFPMPRMVDVRQHFATDHIPNVAEAVTAQLSTLALPDLTGKRIALTAGSRGVANQALVLRTVAAWLTARGAWPFIVPAMGSHGGATGEGQRDIIAGYGITEEAMGVPILATMDTVEVGRTDFGYPVYCDAHAFAADYIFPVHRVKPHTGFKAAVESGLCKMLVIGLGKHKGAVHIHNQGIARMGEIIPAAAGVLLASGKVLAGLALVENAYDQTMHIEAVLPERLVERDQALLVMAKDALPRIYAEASDVLVVEEIGKHISGTGMDPNITGRSVRNLDFGVCANRRIVVLSVGEESHGNAAGLGLADVTTRAAAAVDWAATYTNSITAGVPEISRLPMVANTDEDAIRIALCAVPGLDPARARIIQIPTPLISPASECRKRIARICIPRPNSVPNRSLCASTGTAGWSESLPPTERNAHEDFEGIPYRGGFRLRCPGLVRRHRLRLEAEPDGGVCRHLQSGRRQ